MRYVLVLCASAMCYALYAMRYALVLYAMRYALCAMRYALHAMRYMVCVCANASTMVVHQCQATSMSICGPMPVAAGGVG